MNLEAKLNSAVDDVLRSAGFIFEVLNHNTRNSNIILGPNNRLVNSEITEQLSASLKRFDSILDETVGKFNDTRWCIEQILENKHKQEELRLKEEMERQRRAEQERIKREEEAKRKREEDEREAQRKKQEEEAAAAAAAAKAEQERLAKERLEKEKLAKERAEEERKRKEAEAERIRKKQQEEEEARNLGFDAGFNFSPGFDFNMNDFSIPNSANGMDEIKGNTNDALAPNDDDNAIKNNFNNATSATSATTTGGGGGATITTTNNTNTNTNINNNNNNNNNKNVNANAANNNLNVEPTTEMTTSKKDLNNAATNNQNPDYMTFSNDNTNQIKSGGNIEDDMNNILGTDTSLLEGLDMDLYDGNNGLDSGNIGEEEFDVDSFLHQFGGE